MRKIDILDREKIVERIFHLIDHMTDNNISSSFAINGSWGSGKTFVLDMLQERLDIFQTEKTNDNKFFVIRYNCWNYDYYEEPLIAIVSSLLSIIDQKTKVISSKSLREAEGILKAVGGVLLAIGSMAIKNKIGLDISKAYEIIENGKTSGAEEYANDNQYDIYFSFKRVMERLSEALDKISEEYSIIFMVDELDRCLPEYAVKVLERLHHMTEEKSNIITIIAIDKERLESSIKNIFGFNDSKKYLEKFIQFEIKLSKGNLSEQVALKYEDYFSLFDKDLFPFLDSVEEYFREVFRNIDIRTQEQLMNKVMLVHTLLFSSKKDYTFMCMEILISILIYVYDENPDCFETKAIEVVPWEKVFSVGEKQPIFAYFFREKFAMISYKQQFDFGVEKKSYVLPEEFSLYGAILFTWYWMHEKKGDIIIEKQSKSIYDSIFDNIKELKQFSETFKMIS